MTKYRVFQAFVLGFIAVCLWILIPPSTAQAAATCANVRCSSGTCVDTPRGPTCQQPRLTCASTLCAQGSRCVETTTGPTCVANTTRPSRPSYGHTNYGHSNYGHNSGWRRYHRPQHHRPYTPRRYNYGGQYGYGGYVNPRRYDYGGHGYVTPRPTPRPRPYPSPRPHNPNNTVCASIYKPVCAQKQVQCFRAPCPPVQQTFSNACEANKAGYTVRDNGVCNHYK